MSSNKLEKILGEILGNDDLKCGLLISEFFIKENKKKKYPSGYLGPTYSMINNYVSDKNIDSYRLVRVFAIMSSRGIIHPRKKGHYYLDSKYVKRN